MHFDKTDIAQLDERGVSIEAAQRQLEQLSNGFPTIKIDRPATTGDGIFRFDESTIDALLELFKIESPRLNLMKFVPASGAATRMFQALYAATPEMAEQRSQFLDNLERFAFYAPLQETARAAGKDLNTLREDAPQELFDLVLQPEGLGYGGCPKGLVLFHNYPDGPRTAFEEHLFEGAHHAVGSNRTLRVHYTVQPDWLDQVRGLLDTCRPDISARFGLSDVALGFSVQSPATDTLALAGDGKPARDKDGSLLFRPGGHGALLYNLNDLEADLIFIKNIDNIVANHHKYQSILYKKALGGLAIQLQQRIHRYCRAIDKHRVPVSLRREMEQFLKDWLLTDTPEHLTRREHKGEFLEWAHNRFHRPLRVCGMVRNQGEPGGGPFWVNDTDGNASLQIVEKSQIDLDDATQAEALKKATHFNPVDLVCCTRNYKGEAYDLNKFVDPETGFISEKSHNGKTIKALELPGLWNGAMAHWNTVFVEVPEATFSPVKTVNDLLRPLHQ